MPPFVCCINSGSIHSDACPSFLAEYRRAAERIDHAIETLTRQRDPLVDNLAVASRRLMDEMAVARLSDYRKHDGSGSVATHTFNRGALFTFHSSGRRIVLK